jgi:hypothetical protein
VTDGQQSTFLPTGVRDKLGEAAAPIGTSGVIVICGFPASGKSSAARFLAERIGAVVLDKDQLAPLLEESIMGRLTGDPFDRDTDTYRDLVAPGIYDSLIRTGLTVAERHPWYSRHRSCPPCARQPPQPAHSVNFFDSTPMRVRNCRS